MKFIVPIIAHLLFTISFAQSEEKKVFNIQVEHETLKNGLDVVWAPSDEAKNISIKVDVKVGYDTEEKPNFGVSHLLEHVLFRDKNLKDDMSFLQLIKEKGGSANGTTKSRLTNYYGTIKASHGPWLLKQFYTMIMKSEVNDKYVANEKKTIKIERGEAGNIEKLLGFDPLMILNPPYLDKKDFWERHFNLPPINSYNLVTEQLSTDRLTTAQVQEHFNKYYYPRNMRIYITGKYNKKNIQKVLSKFWEKVPDTTGEKIAERNKPVMTENKFTSRQVSSSYLYISTGFKVQNLSILDYWVLQSYYNNLSHELMKSLRNLKGQAYSVSVNRNISNNYGVFGISLVPLREDYYGILDIIENRIKDELHGGKYTKEQFLNAKKLVNNALLLKNKDSNYMMRFASISAKWKDITGDPKLYYQEFLNITYEEYLAVLKKHSKPELKYTDLFTPNLFFQKDDLVLFTIFTLFLFMLSRVLLTKRFVHSKVKFVKKLSYPPLFFAEIGLLGIVFFACLHFDLILSGHIWPIGFFEEHIILSSYICSLIELTVFMGVAQAIIMRVPKKIYIMDYQLVVKSFTYYSKQIPLAQVSRIEAISFFELLKSPIKLFKNIMRVHQTSYKLFTPGLAIELENGEFYFYSVKDIEKYIVDLQGFCDDAKKVDVQEVSETSEAA